MLTHRNSFAAYFSLCDTALSGEGMTTTSIIMERFGSISAGTIQDSYSAGGIGQLLEMLYSELYH